MVVGYQKRSTNAFLTFSGKTLIDEPYVDGISITYGSPRKHVWSYAAGLSESYSRDQIATCPCSWRGGTRAPSFVRNHHYCESGSTIDGVNLQPILLVILCGTVKVAVGVIVVLSPTFHGSIIKYH